MKDFSFDWLIGIFGTPKSDDVIYEQPLSPIKPGTFWTFYDLGGGRSAPKLSPELLEGMTCSKKGLKLSSPYIWTSLTQFSYLSHLGKASMKKKRFFQTAISHELSD